MPGGVSGDHDASRALCGWLSPAIRPPPHPTCVFRSRGQLLAIADSSGFITEAYAGSGHDQSSWQGAGLTTQAQTFDPRKWQTNDQWGGIQQFRNRAYDPATGTWIQEDPMGVAGGVNVYRFNNGNPVSFGDPLGLCPPGNTNVEDCPADQLGNAWRVLAKSAVGRAVIAAYVASGFSVDTGSGANRTNRSEKTVTVIGSHGPGAIAVGLAHEVVHANGTAEFGTPLGGEEESAAWDQALRVYDALKGQDRKDAQPRYRDEAEKHRSRHGQFHREKYCAGANYNNTKKCN
ncbi:MAG: RHS repeat-associated core domain-containing protein [Gemmatimonadales bacterium]|nr:RHS repeat-associated core domain-containing protein [Gemmatimonadales bacterium]